jgi:hypothetical protein
VDRGESVAHDGERVCQREEPRDPRAADRHGGDRNESPGEEPGRDRDRGDAGVYSCSRRTRATGAARVRQPPRRTRDHALQIVTLVASPSHGVSTSTRMAETCSGSSPQPHFSAVVFQEPALDRSRSGRHNVALRANRLCDYVRDAGGGARAAVERGAGQGGSERRETITSTDAGNWGSRSGNRRVGRSGWERRRVPGSRRRKTRMTL